MRYEVSMPRREAGLWLDASNAHKTYAGCDVCGWEESGEYDEMREKWLSHTHDPVWDIRHRLADLKSRSQEIQIAKDYICDIEYLLETR